MCMHVKVHRLLPWDATFQRVKTLFVPLFLLVQNPKKHKKGKGQLRVEHAEIQRRPTLLDFLAGGLQISMTVRLTCDMRARRRVLQVDIPGMYTCVYFVFFFVPVQLILLALLDQTSPLPGQGRHPVTTHILVFFCFSKLVCCELVRCSKCFFFVGL